MNNNTSKLIPVVLILIALGAFFYISNKAPDTTSDSTATDENVADVMVETETANTMTPKEVPDGATKIMFEDGSEARYVAQKRFLEKADDVIVGTSKDVTGEGYYDENSGTIYLFGKVGLLSLVSNSKQRDSDLKGYFTNEYAYFEGEATELTGLLESSDFSFDIPGTLTINDVSNEVTLTVSGNVVDGVISATGSVEVNMSDFGITPPSLAGVFTVDDAIVFELDVVGSLGSPSVMMEDVDAKTESMNEDTGEAPVDTDVQ